MKIKCNTVKIYLLWVFAILANIKSIFTDFGVDQAYAVATSYRHIMGDRSFLEMWEPHQTSSFLTDFLMWLYKSVVYDLEGVVLFLQICGVLLCAIITYCIYKELLHWLEGELVHYMCILFFVFRPKQSVFPEFSNMMIWFSALCFICLLRFFRSAENKSNLVSAAFFLCLQILSYPTSVINYLCIVGILYFWSKNKWKNIGIFTGTCMICGALYLGIILSQSDFKQLLTTIGFIIRADGSHMGERVETSSYFGGLGYSVLWLGGVLVVTYLICRVRRKCKAKLNFATCFGVVMLLSEIIMAFISANTMLDWSCQYFVVLLILIFGGLFSHKYIGAHVNIIYVVGTMVAACSAIAVAMLTNLGLLDIISYLILAAMVSLIPIYEKNKCVESRIKNSGHIILCILLLILFHRGMFVSGFASQSGIKLTLNVENIIRVGPAKGIVASVQKCNEIKYGLEDWKNNIHDDTVLVVVPWLLDSLVYVNTEADIATFSTINTPTYDENLLHYWEMYPDKVPTVIAVQGWNGEMAVSEDTWIMQWVNENYSQYTNGYYWRFYRRE